MNNCNLMVVDDEPLVRAFVKSVIQKEKLPVSLLIEAENGFDAIHFAAQHKFDLILMDIRIPGMDGIAATENILAANPDTKIIIISAYDEFEYARNALRAGACDYLLKPIRPDDLVHIIFAVNTTKSNTTDHVISSEGIRPKLISDTCSYVQKNLKNKLSLVKISKTVFVSPSHLSRTFKKETGQSLVDYITEQRVLKAKKLLLETNLSITDIAAEVGFDSAAYFSTCFKNQLGFSPRDYKKHKKL